MAGLLLHAVGRLEFGGLTEAEDIFNDGSGAGKGKNQRGSTSLRSSSGSTIHGTSSDLSLRWILHKWSVTLEKNLGGNGRDKRSLVE